jgi:hypothetical protein
MPADPVPPPPRRARPHWRVLTRCTPLPPVPQVLIKTYGPDLFRAGIFKLLWTCFLIMGGEHRALGSHAARRLAGRGRTLPRVHAASPGHAPCCPCAPPSAP